MNAKELAEKWIGVYQKAGALWIHDDNPKRPHALLTSGKHSNGFFNSELVMEQPHQLNLACLDLTELLQANGVQIRDVDCVVGPAMGAITLAHEIARVIAQAKDVRQCRRAYAEKEDVGPNGKTMVFKRTTIHQGEVVLVCEDVTTTAGSVDLTTEAVLKAGGIVPPFIAVLVNRSGLTEVNGRKIVALIDRPMPMWVPEECPLCKQGSEALRPKGKEAWAELNAQYPLEMPRTLEDISLTASRVGEHQDCPQCPQCGHTTVRNGACFKCINCGESIGCS